MFVLKEQFMALFGHFGYFGFDSFLKSDYRGKVNIIYD